VPVPRPGPGEVLVRNRAAATSNADPPMLGAHASRRVERAGSYHTRWAQDGREVRTGA